MLMHMQFTYTYTHIYIFKKQRCFNICLALYSAAQEKPAGCKKE